MTTMGSLRHHVAGCMPCEDHVAYWQSSEVCERPSRFGLTTVMFEPTWTEGHEDHPGTQKHRRGEL